MKPEVRKAQRDQAIKWVTADMLFTKIGDDLKIFFNGTHKLE